MPESYVPSSQARCEGSFNFSLTDVVQAVMFLLAKFSGSELEAAAGYRESGDAEERSEHYAAQPTTSCSSFNMMVDWQWWSKTWLACFRIHRRPLCCSFPAICTPFSRATNFLHFICCCCWLWSSTVAQVNWDSVCLRKFQKRRKCGLSPPEILSHGLLSSLIKVSSVRCVCCSVNFVLVF